MMRHVQRLSIVCMLLAAFVFGCATVRVSQDFDVTTDFSRLKTFTWQTGPQEKTGDVRVDNPLLDSRVRAAVEKSLSDSGFQQVEKEPLDFYISYNLSIRQRIDSSRARTSVGIGVGGSGTFGSVGVSGSPVRQIDEGMLVIDITDAKGGKLLWRGTGTYEIRREQDPQSTTETINKVVNKIMAQFPPQAPK